MEDIITDNNPENTAQQESKIEEIMTDNINNDQEQMISQEFVSNQIDLQEQQLEQQQEQQHQEQQQEQQHQELQQEPQQEQQQQPEEQQMNEQQFVNEILEENNAKIEEQSEKISEAEAQQNNIETETNTNINQLITDNNRMEDVVEQENQAVIMNPPVEHEDQNDNLNPLTEQEVRSQHHEEQMDQTESNVLIENIEQKVEEQIQTNAEENQEKNIINENLSINEHQKPEEAQEECKQPELIAESQSVEQDLEAAMVRDIMSSTHTNTTAMDIIDTSDLKPVAEQKDLNQLVDSLINDVCNPDAANKDEDEEQIKLDDSSNTDAVADVVAAVEAAAKSNPSGTTSTTTPKSAKKKKANPSPTKPTISNHLNNSLNQTDTSPLSSNQKRRKKDPYAPKAPLNGYLVYFNEERAEMRSKNPNMSFGELTKIIAAKWKELPNEDKQKYINEADIDKERYVKEMADYKKSDAYKQFLKENAQSKYLRQDETSQSHADACFNRVPGTSQPNLNWLQNESNVAGFDIPIFTEEFIEHSRNREQEMRTLRKELNELEQQNSVLNKHIDNLKQSTNKIEQDIEHYKNSNNQLQKNLDLFRQTVLHCFNNIPLPNTQDYPTPANIDEYIMRLYNIVNIINQNENNPNNMNDQFYVNNRSFALHVKSVFSKINFNSLFECV